MKEPEEEKTIKRRRLRRLFSMQPHEIAWVDFGANHRPFAVVKGDPMGKPVLTLNALEQAHTLLGELIPVLKAQPAMTPEASKAFGEKLDTIAMLIVPDIAPPEDATLTLKEQTASLCKQLESLSHTAMATDYTFGDQVDAALELAKTIAGAVQSTDMPAPPLPVLQDVAAAAAGAVAGAEAAMTATATETEVEGTSTVEASAPEAAAEAATTTSSTEITEAAETGMATESATSEDSTVEADKAERKSPPKGYPSDPSQYLDPQGWKYPVDTEEHVRAALSYLSQESNASKYSDSQLKTMWSKLKAAANKFGITVGESTGKAAPCDEDAEKKPAETEKADAVTAADTTAATTLVETVTEAPQTVNAEPAFDIEAVKALMKSAVDEAIAPILAEMAELKVQKAAPKALPSMPAAPANFGTQKPKELSKIDALESLDFTQSPDLKTIDEYGRIKA